MEKEREFLETEIGRIEVRSTYPYPCRPEPGITEMGGNKRTVVTASHSFCIPEHGNEQIRISPVVYQSCMHPEQIHIDAVRIVVEGGEISFQVREQRWIIPESEAGSVDILPWEAELEKKSCFPCTNCGCCSW